MRFFSQALRGDLILIKRYTPPPAARARMARPAPKTESILIRLILWLCLAIGRPLVRLTDNAGRAIRDGRRAWPVVMFLASIMVGMVLETIARHYIEQMIMGG